MVGVGFAEPCIAITADSSSASRGAGAPFVPQKLASTQSLPGSATLKLYSGGCVVYGASPTDPQPTSDQLRLLCGAAGDGARLELKGPDGFAVKREAASIQVLKPRPDASLWPLGRTGAAALVISEELNGALGGAQFISQYNAVIAIFTSGGWKPGETEEQ